MPSGLQSQVIRQCLLKNFCLTYERPLSRHDLSKWLNASRSRADQKLFTLRLHPVIPNRDQQLTDESIQWRTPKIPQMLIRSPASVSSVGPVDMRNHCSARNAVCKAWDKKGHYLKVCRSSKNTALSALNLLSLKTLTAAPSSG